MAINDLMGRINRLFHGLMGCSLDFQASENLIATDWSAHDLALLATANSATGANTPIEVPKYFAGASSSTFGFPVRAENSILGLAIVRGWPGTDIKKLLLLAELLTIVLEHGLMRENRAERLRMIEERLRMVDVSSNVIPLGRARLSSLQITEIEELPEPIESPVTSLPLLIETNPGFPLHRIAVEIHQMSRRWAFLSTDDLPAQIFESRESVQELGGITLFVKDLADLSTNQQLKLAEYLAIQPGTDMPQVIAGISAPLDELLQNAKILPHLADLFCHTQLKWSGKSAEQVTSELVKASLEHILEQTRQESMVGEDNMIPFNIQYFNPEQPSVH